MKQRHAERRSQMREIVLGGACSLLKAVHRKRKRDGISLDAGGEERLKIRADQDSCRGRALLKLACQRVRLSLRSFKFEKRKGGVKDADAVGGELCRWHYQRFIERRSGGRRKVEGPSRRGSKGHGAGVGNPVLLGRGTIKKTSSASTNQNNKNKKKKSFTVSRKDEKGSP